MMRKQENGPFLNSFKSYCFPVYGIYYSFALFFKKGRPRDF